MTYEGEIAEIARRMDTAGPRLRGLFGNFNRAMSEFAEARPAGITADERGLLLAFEEMFIEAINDCAALLHGRGDTGGARECLDLVQRLRDLVQGTIDTHQ